MATDIFAEKNGANTRTNLLAYDPEKLTVVEDKSSPLYDERVKLPVNEHLINSIMANGVLQPVLVTRNGGRLEVVDGRQRVRAAREASKRMGSVVNVPVLFKRGSDGDLFGLTVASNELRTADTPSVRARKMQRHYDLTGGDVNSVALAFGVSPHTVRQSLSLLETTEAVQTAVDEKRLSLSGAAAIAKTEKANQNKVLSTQIGDAVEPSKPKAARAYVRKQKTLAEIRVEIQRLTDSLECDVLSVSASADLKSKLSALRWAAGESDAPEPETP